MTVSSTNTKKSYNGNGTLSVFAYDFKITAASELTVLTRLDSTGVETTETLNTGYIVDGVDNASGGNVDYDVIGFYSNISNYSNATLSLLNFDLEMRGINSVNVSDSQEVIISPLPMVRINHQNPD